MIVAIPFKSGHRFLLKAIREHLGLSQSQSPSNRVTDSYVAAWAPQKYAPSYTVAIPFKSGHRFLLGKKQDIASPRIEGRNPLQIGSQIPTHPLWIYYTTTCQNSFSDDPLPPIPPHGVPHFFWIATEAHNHPISCFRRSILALSLFEAVFRCFKDFQFERRND